MTAREDVLARLRAATSEETTAVEVPRAYRTAGTHEPGSPDLLALFTERLEDYQAKVRGCTARTLTKTVSTAIAERGVRRIVVAPGLLRPMAKALEAVEVVSDEPALSSQELDRVGGVITGSAIAVAETGTIVLDGGTLSGRRALTLVPDYHLVIVRAEQVVESVPEAVARLDQLAPLTWVSGPSATSDIELSRVEGVHGPRTLEVVLVR